VGLSRSQLEQLADTKTTPSTKVSRRDIAAICATRGNGGTTIAGTMVIAHMAGIKVFATGGLGGVHRGGENSMSQCS
jgi:pseudouridylate synthase / pseudouridine kinase